MSRRRYVSTKISQDTRVNRLAIEYGDFAALLYTWMIPHAADDATLPGDPEELLYQVLPARRDKGVEDVLAALDGMAALGLVQSTEDGRIAFPTPSFYRYQTYIKDRNKRGGDAPEPARNSAPSQPSQTNGALPRKSAQNTASFNPSPSPSPSPSVVRDAPTKAPARERRKSAVLERTPEESTVLSILARVPGFPPDVGDETTEHLREIGADYEGADLIDVAKSLKLKGQPVKNGWLTFRNWVKTQATSDQERRDEASRRNGQGRRNRFEYQADRLAVGAPGSHGAGGTDSWATGPPLRTGRGD